MQRLIRSPIKNCRNATAGSLFGICIWIQPQIHILPTNSTKHSQLYVADSTLHKK